MRGMSAPNVEGVARHQEETLKEEIKGAPRYVAQVKEEEVVRQGTSHLDNTWEFL